MNITIAVCDDSAADRDWLSGQVHRWPPSGGIPSGWQSTRPPRAFCFAYAEDKTVQVLLLDIEMGQMVGVTMARTLRSDNDGVQIVFITDTPTTLPTATRWRRCTT